MITLEDQYLNIYGNKLRCGHLASSGQAKASD